jgi:phage shock protein A
MKTANPTEIRELTLKLSKAVAQMADVKEDSARLAGELKKLQNQPTNTEAQAAIAALDQENTELAERLALLQGGTKTVTKEDKIRIEKEYLVARKAWLSRKKMVYTCLI